jgi:hypothetical protein
MSWRPTHVKSRVLDVHFLNWTYAYTNEGEAVCSWCGKVRGLYINWRVQFLLAVAYVQPTVLIAVDCIST